MHESLSYRTSVYFSFSRMTSGQATSKVKFDRRRAAMDSDDDDLDEL